MTNREPSREEIEAALGDAAEVLGRKVGALDAEVGRWVGRAKAAAWMLGALAIGLIGWGAYAALTGTGAYAASAIAAAIVLFAAAQAWRNLSKPVRASEILREEAESRIAVVGLAGRLASFIGLGPKKR
ncbi:MAG: hypothetical protein AAFQ21_04440 [Pseudomonadota bacterium]